MPTLDALERYLWWLAIAGHLALFARIWFSGLRSTYRYFSWYLLFRIVRSLGLEFLPWLVAVLQDRPNLGFDSRTYARVWVGTQPVLWFFYILVVLELYSLVLKNYRGIATLSRWALWAALCLSVGISVLTLGPDLASQGQQPQFIHYIGVIDRGILSSLVLFLLFITSFLAWYPIPLSRNVVVHCVSYATYFLSITLALLVRNLSGTEVTQQVNVVLSGVTVGCLAVWVLFLNRRGEAKTVVARPQWKTGEEEDLIQQLTAINSTLLRAVRK